MYNCYFRELGPNRDGATMIEVAPGVFVPWLGTIDRSVARIIEGATEIPLGLSGWRLRELDQWKWISDEQTFIGCLLDGLGVFAVLDYERPLLKLKRKQPGSHE